MTKECRYDLSPPSKSKFSTHKQLGLFFMAVIVSVFLIAYKQQATIGKFSQNIISQDYEDCLTAVCVTLGGGDFQECIPLYPPEISNVKIVKEKYARGGDVKRLEINPLGLRCGDF